MERVARRRNNGTTRMAWRRMTLQQRKADASLLITRDELRGWCCLASYNETFHASSVVFGTDAFSEGVAWRWMMARRSPSGSCEIFDARGNPSTEDSSLILHFVYELVNPLSIMNSRLSNWCFCYPSSSQLSQLYSPLRLIQFPLLLEPPTAGSGHSEELGYAGANLFQRGAHPRLAESCKMYNQMQMESGTWGGHIRGNEAGVPKTVGGFSNELEVHQASRNVRRGC